MDREHRPDVENSQPEWMAALSGRQSLRNSLVQETSMTLIWLGVLLVFGGMLQMAYQPIWRGRLSGRTGLRSRRSDSLEPERPASGFGDQIELAWNCDGRAWRRYLAGRGCHLSLKLISGTLSGRCALSAEVSVIEPCLLPNRNVGSSIAIGGKPDMRRTAQLGRQ